MSESVSDESVFDSFRLSAIVAWCVDPCGPRWTQVNGKKFTFQFSKRVKSEMLFLEKKSEIVHVTLHFVMKNLYFW